MAGVVAGIQVPGQVQVQHAVAVVAGAPLAAPEVPVLAQIAVQSIEPGLNEGQFCKVHFPFIQPVVHVPVHHGGHFPAHPVVVHLQQGFIPQSGVHDGVVVEVQRVAVDVEIILAQFLKGIAGLLWVVVSRKHSADSQVVQLQQPFPGLAPFGEYVIAPGLQHIVPVPADAHVEGQAVEQFHHFVRDGLAVADGAEPDALHVFQLPDDFFHQREIDKGLTSVEVQPQFRLVVVFIHHLPDEPVHVRIHMP